MTNNQPGIDPATLAPGTPVEVEYSTDGDRTLTYVHDADCHAHDAKAGA